MLMAKKHLIRRGFTDVEAYFAVATDGYVQNKYKNHATSSEHRIAMTNLLADCAPEFVRKTTKTYGSAKQLISDVKRNYDASTTTFFVVTGADRGVKRRTTAVDKIEHIVIARNGTDDVAVASSAIDAPEETLDLSATIVRRKLCVGCDGKTHSNECNAAREAALKELVASSHLSAEVAKYMLENPTAVAIVAPSISSKTT